MGRRYLHSDDRRLNVCTEIFDMNATSPPSSASNLEGWKPEVSPLSEGVFHRINYPENGGIRFRRFHVLPADRQLIRDSRAIDLGSRAFDILMILLDRRGAVVSRHEIQEYVWPSMIVEESNLRVQMASLRKALGPDRDLIKTIPGRGYLFVAETQALGASTREDTASSDEAARPAPARQETGVGNLSQRRPLVAVIDDDRDTREALRVCFPLSIFRSRRSIRFKHSTPAGWRSLSIASCRMYGYRDRAAWNCRRA